MSHFANLPRTFQQEWNNRPDNADLRGANLGRDGQRFYWVDGADGQEIIQWECRNFPGCASLVVTTKVELREDLRGRGLGRYFREMRHRAYKAAGFVGEIATVRTDNAAQNRLMQTMGAVRMGEFPSDFGGSYALWLTQLQNQPTVRAPIPAAPPLPYPPIANPARAEAAEAQYQAFAAPPTTVREYMERAREAGHDALGVANDPEWPVYVTGRRPRTNIHRKGL